jgi:hypothetical protein
VNSNERVEKMEDGLYYAHCRTGAVRCFANREGNLCRGKRYVMNLLTTKVHEYH